MPITPFQLAIMRLIATNRSPDSHVAGGLVINRDADSFRTTEDIDLFQDSESRVGTAFAQDCLVLRAAGYAVAEESVRPGFCRAVVSRDGQGVRLEWVRDSACRFLPPVRDPDFGWRLSDLDVAINKVLALSGRVEGRDVSDVIWLDAHGFPLGLLVWAAPGKDPGMSPDFILEEMRANAKSPSAVELTASGSPFTPQELKRRWLTLAARCSEDLERARLAGLRPGIVYFDTSGPVWGEPLWSANRRALTEHAPSLGGVWPSLLPA